MVTPNALPGVNCSRLKSRTKEDEHLAREHKLTKLPDAYVYIPVDAIAVRRKHKKPRHVDQTQNGRSDVVKSEEMQVWKQHRFQPSLRKRCGIAAASNSGLPVT